MRKPSMLMICGALTLALVGCNTSEQAETEESVPPSVETETENATDVTPDKKNEQEDSKEQEIVEPAPEEQGENDTTPETSIDETVQPESDIVLEENGMANVALDTLILVNKKIGLPADYRPDDLVTANISFVESATGDRKMLRKEAAQAIEKLMAAATAAGIDLKGTSAFRSYDYQVQLFDNYVARDGKEQAMKYSAPPGHSEHQTGLAIDVSSASVGYGLTQSLEKTTEGKWLADNAHTYGFIIRYQRAYEAETGYMFEPWHLRYVGVDHATNVYEMDVPFERYLAQLMD